MPGSVVSRVDHVMVRADDPRTLAKVLSEKLGLPILQPQNMLPGAFTSVILSLGDTPLELIHFGRLPEEPSAATTARLWGVAFEPAAPLPETKKELRERRVPHGPPMTFEQPRQNGGWQRMWTTLAVGVLSGGWKVRALLAVQRIFGGLQRAAMRRAVKAVSEGRPARGMDETRMDSLNDTLGHGWTFFSEFDPAFADSGEVQESSRKALAEVRGGPLGVEGLDEVIVGAKDLEAARERWRRLLAPAREVQTGLWRPDGGPAVRVVAGERDELVSLVLKVGSLEKARSYLEDQNLLHAGSGGEVRVSPGAIGGLEVRLVE